MAKRFIFERKYKNVLSEEPRLQASRFVHQNTAAVDAYSRELEQILVSGGVRSVVESIESLNKILEVYTSDVRRLQKLKDLLEARLQISDKTVLETAGVQAPESPPQEGLDQRAPDAPVGGTSPNSPEG